VVAGLPAEAVSPRAAEGRVGRDGALHLRLERRGTRTVVTECRSMLPLQILAPLALDDSAVVLSIVNPTGGVVGGDRLVIDVHAGRSAHVCLTTPSATKIYRATGDPAGQAVGLYVAPGAAVEWVPDHTIPFAGAAFRQSLCARVEDGGALILVDAYAAGRVARGETWRFRTLESTLAVHDGRGCLLYDRFALRGDGDPPWSGLGLAGSHPYFASVVVVADAGVEELLETIGAMVPANDARIAAARLSRRGAVARCLARSAPALGGLIETVWAAARRAVLGAPALALRKP
jgi:urease accessory protein